MGQETYKITVSCNNCKFNEEIELEKGIRPQETECPNCGCFELSRHDSPILIQ